MESGKCGVCGILLTEINMQKANPYLCSKCFQMQISLFKEGTKRLPYKEASKICEGLWLGEEASATDKVRLKALGIGRILIVGSYIEKLFPDDFAYLQIEIDDSPGSDLYSHFDEIFAFINEGAKTKQGVLVHCVSGISRSASAVISYLMRKKKLTYVEAFDFVRVRRGCICPNSGFVAQLKKHQLDVMHI